MSWLLLALATAWALHERRGRKRAEGRHEDAVRAVLRLEMERRKRLEKGQRSGH